MNNDTTGYDIFDDLGNTDLSTIDTSMPVLAPGIHSFTIEKMERQQWKSGLGSSLTITLRLVDDGVDVSGEKTVNAGYTVIDRISLVKKGKYDPMQAIARFLDALGTRDQGFDQSFGSYVGQNVTVKTKVRPETQAEDGTTYPAQTEVASYIKA